MPPCSKWPPAWETQNHRRSATGERSEPEERRALLGESAGTESVDAYAAPARATSWSGLPPAYVDVGELDIFCDEAIAYAQRLLAAHVPTELHVHPGAPHAFELFAPDADVSRRAMADRVRALRSF